MAKIGYYLELLIGVLVVHMDLSLKEQLIFSFHLSSILFLPL